MGEKWCIPWSPACATEFFISQKIIDECAFVHPHFDLFGGEPLLYPFWADIIERIKFYRSSVDIPTNGTLLKNNASLLVETGADRLWISLDGPPLVNDAQRGVGVYKRVIDGMREIAQIKQEKASPFPALGITYVVTPLNYHCIEELFLSTLDLSCINHISIEFQKYITREQFQLFEDVLSKKLGIKSSEYARGLIAEIDQFQAIDPLHLSQQIAAISKEAHRRSIYFVTHPVNTDPQTIRHFFAAEWNHMREYRTYCPFPWSFAEISARGMVTCCHSFYELSAGNVNNESIATIWNNDKMCTIRSIIKKTLFPICPSCCSFYHNSLVGRSQLCDR